MNVSRTDGAGKGRSDSDGGRVYITSFRSGMRLK